MRSLFQEVSDGIRSFAPSRFPYARFVLALAIGLAGALAFVYMNTPLPWLLGSMAATTIAALAGARIAAPGVVRTPMVVIVGVMVGASFAPDVLVRFVDWWPTVIGVLAATVVSGVACVTFLRVFAGFDMPTAYFSGMPGGLVEMVTLGEERGAEIRTIALVHSVRILVIVFSVPIIVSLIEGVVVSTSSVPRPSVMDTALVDYVWLVGTAIVGIVAGHLLRMPAIYLLGPLTLSAIVHAAGITEFKLPSEILSLAQLVVGASVGCRFVGVASGMIYRIFGLSMIMSLVLVGVTALFAFLLARLTEYGFVPLFIAYAPGGLPEMSLVAIAIHIEVAFVATHHIVRLFFVMGGAPLAFALFRKGD